MSRKVVVCDAKNLCRCYIEGESEKAISDRLNIGRSVTRRVLVENGVEIRSMSASAYPRQSRATPEERRKNAEAAHAAVRGTRQSFEHLCKRAATNEQRGLMSKYERTIFDALQRFNPIPQKAVDAYNIDLAFAERSVAVEVFGGGWHKGGRHAKRFRKRTDYLLNRGWEVIIVWVIKHYPLTKGTIDYILARLKIPRSAKPKRCQELVIYGTGEVIPASSYNPNNGSTVKRFKGSDRIRGDNGRFSK